MNVLLIFPPDRVNRDAVCLPHGLEHIASVFLKEGIEERHLGAILRDV